MKIPLLSNLKIYHLLAIFVLVFSGCSLNKSRVDGGSCNGKAKCCAKDKTCPKEGTCGCKQAGATCQGDTSEMPSKEEMQVLWKEFMTPGPDHKVLNALVGNWRHTVEFWMDPSAPPEVSKGSSTIKWVMGGRFLEHSATGKSMGVPFVGKGVTGFDKATKQYQTVWYDSMGTSMMIGSGYYDPTTRVLTEQGSASCPIKKGAIPFKGVTTLIDSKHFRYELFMTQPRKDGQDSLVRVMKIEYVRGK